MEKLKVLCLAAALMLLICFASRGHFGIVYNGFVENILF